MPYEDTKKYLDFKPGALSYEEKEYINLNLKMYSTLNLISRLNKLKLTEKNNPTKTEVEELVNLKEIIINRIQP